MNHLRQNSDGKAGKRLTFTAFSMPAKALATCVIFTLSIAMLGAMGQIIIHDIIPTFFSEEAASEDGMAAAYRDNTPAHGETSASGTGRGDLFADLEVKENEPEKQPFYKGEQFVWTLKWTHIHLFGMSMIFMFLGGITLFLNAGTGLRTWLIVLPFIGVLVDIASMWLKAFVSPAFFWLHIPGGGVFTAVFVYVSLRALWEMWFTRPAG